MDQQGNGQSPFMGGLVGGATQMGYMAANQMMSANPGTVFTQPGSIQTAGQATAFSASPNQLSQQQLAQQQLAYHQIHQQQDHQSYQQLQLFWANQYHDVKQTTDFKNHSLPLARIKKIMKADEDVRMISAEAPVVFAKACEMFILELTLRSWNHTEENKRRTLQKNDIAAAILRTDIFDFLADIVPKDEVKDEGLGPAPRTSAPGVAVAGPPETLPYYCMPGQQIGSQGMMVGNPVMDQSFYTQNPGPYMAQQVWQQSQHQQAFHHHQPPASES